MKKKPAIKHQVFSQDLIDELVYRLKHNGQIRQPLPLGGRLNMDRPLPFMCLYRRPAKMWDGGTESLITGQASYLIASQNLYQKSGLQQLLKAIISLMSQEFGSFLLLEVWSMPPSLALKKDHSASIIPEFNLYTPSFETHPSLITVFETALKKTKNLKQNAVVQVFEKLLTQKHPAPLFSLKEAQQLNCHLMGLSVASIYQDRTKKKIYPLVINSFHRSLTKVFKKAFYHFVRTYTSDRPQHYQALGKRQLVKAVWESDGKLATISESFDLLLSINPINAQGAWTEFKRKKFIENPKFYYPPLAIDPSLLKKNLYAIPLNKVEDPVIEEIFNQKRQEIDRQLTLLLDRDTKRFKLGSLQLYGEIENTLLAEAKKILEQVPARTREDSGAGSYTAEEFVKLAQKEINAYQKIFKPFKAEVRFLEGPASLMVSRGHLYVGKNMKIPKRRANGLIHHEVGTHLLTYYNALNQPFKLLHSGLAGYDELQEGLAVLAEYLSGGLSRPRLRILAARVVAAHMMVTGADFVEVFKELDRYYEFDQRSAFTVTLRVYRGGGLTKDAVYLRGLVNLLQHFQKSSFLENLFVGKFSMKHLPLIQDLLRRNILNSPPLLPFYMKETAARQRLDQITHGISVIQLTEGKQS